MPTGAASHGRRGLVVAALSGGVDSGLAAALLLAEGFEVVAATLRMRPPPAGGEARGGDGGEEEGRRPGGEEGEEEESGGSLRSCGNDVSVARARAVAKHLGIRHHVLDCGKLFAEQVLRPAWEEYARGRTPSPCLLCNERIKFGFLLEWARKLGAVALATGHYARVVAGADGRPRLSRGADAAKDQSYFLAGLSAAQLACVRFPLGEMAKEETRSRARALGLPCADTPDSQDACLAAGSGACFAEMLRTTFGGAAVPGLVVAEDGTVLGEHRGIHLFTVGQSRGLPGPSHVKRWVVAIRPEDATLVVTSDSSQLDGSCFRASGLAWGAGGAPPDGHFCQVQVRHRQAPVPARIAAAGTDAVIVALERPVRAITPGQAAVFYDGDIALGRGWIDAALA